MGYLTLWGLSIGIKSGCKSKGIRGRDLRTLRKWAKVTLFYYFGHIYAASKFVAQVMSYSEMLNYGNDFVKIWAYRLT